jgi:transcriptional regulator with XRE-family HTH domain
MKIEEYMAREQITARELARRVGVTEAAVSRWLAGICRPSGRNMARVASVTAGAVMANDWFSSLPGLPTPPGGTCGPERHRGISDGPPPKLAAGGDAGRPFAGVEP